jgi:hypothetical protein
MERIEEEGHHKLYKIKILYNGLNTYTIKPCLDKQGNTLNKGSMIICGDDEAIKKFFIKKEIKDAESNPASFRAIRYMDMVQGIKQGNTKYLWIWKKHWQPSNTKIDLMIKRGQQ